MLPVGYKTKNIGGTLEGDREIVIPGRHGHVTDESAPKGKLLVYVQGTSARHYRALLRRMPDSFQLAQDGHQDGVGTVADGDFPALVGVLRIRKPYRMTDARRAALEAARSKSSLGI